MIDLLRRSFILLVAVSSPLFACSYNLKGETLLQCQAIKEVKGAWTYVDASVPAEGVLAHVYCACETALATPEAECDATQTRRMTFTMETPDVQRTCMRGNALCEPSCRKLMKQQPVLE